MPEFTTPILAKDTPMKATETLTVSLEKKEESIVVTVRNREKLMFEEEVFALTSINEKGVFDVLPEHINFICLIKDFMVIHKKSGERQEMRINRGVLRVAKNKVNIYLVS